MSPEEVERSNKLREEQDRVCKNIMLYCSWSIALVYSVIHICLFNSNK